MTATVHQLPNPTATRLHAAQRGDPGALEALARSLWPSVRRWALLATGDLAAADDVAQEALVRLTQRVGELDPERPVEAWMRTVVRHLALDHHRREEVRHRAPPAVVAARESLERELDLKRSAADTMQAFAALSPRQREVLTRVGEGEHAADVADDLGIAPATARALLYQARRALRAHLAHIPELLRSK